MQGLKGLVEALKERLPSNVCHGNKCETCTEVPGGCLDYQLVKEFNEYESGLKANIEDYKSTYIKSKHSEEKFAISILEKAIEMLGKGE